MLFAHRIFLCDLAVLMTQLATERHREKVVTVARIPKFEANNDKVVEDHPTAVGGVEEDDDEEEDEWEYQDESDVYLRSKFFESWLWKTVDLPAQADGDG